MSDARWSLHFAWGRTPYALDLPEVVIGRGDACTLQIADPEAAEEHARFVVDEGERVWLEDLGSGRPTLLNGRAIAGRTRLGDGDFVQIGHAVLTLRAVARAPQPISTPDARTLMSSDLPDQVRQAIAQRDAAAKNYVVGTAQPHTLSTVMMESPLARPAQPTGAREPQHTVETDAAAPATIAMAAVTDPVAPMTSSSHTLHGVGPGEMDAAPTRIGGPPSATHEMAAAPTMLSDLGGVPQLVSQAELTPLPPPRPPMASVPDLSAQLGLGAKPATSPSRHELATFSSQATQLLAAAHDPAAQAMGTDKTQLPRAAPRAQASLHSQSTQISAVPAEVASLHAQNTQIGATVPPEVDRPSETTTEPSLPAAEAPHRLATAGPYVAPVKGPFGAFSRALAFVHQMLALAKQEPTLKKPIVYNLVIATPMMLAISLLLLVVHSQGAVYAVLSLGTAVLYFVDYVSNAMTASLIYDYVTTGRADVPTAKARVRRSASGILTFAAVSALLDVASTYARERSDLVSKLLLRILRAIWTTATYVIMPALVIEGIPFREALSRSKKLMDHDPTGVGAGVVALSLCSYLLAVIVFPLAFFLMRLGAHLHPVVGTVLFFAMVNVYWAVSGWLKIAYSTLFYLWARHCEAAGRADETLAPLPLRHAIDAG